MADAAGRADCDATRRSTGAFTLVELLVVLALIGLMVSLAGVSLRGAATRMTLDEAAASVAAYDQSARQMAARFGRRVELRFDRDGVAQVWANGEHAERAPLRLPGGFELSLIREHREAEAVAIDVGGRSSTYAFGVRSNAGGERWAVVAGLTGETAWHHDEPAAQSVLTSLSAATRTLRVVRGVPSGAPEGERGDGP